MLKNRIYKGIMTQFIVTVDDGELKDLKLDRKRGLKMRQVARPMIKNQYGQYLLRLADEFSPKEK